MSSDLFSKGRHGRAESVDIVGDRICSTCGVVLEVVDERAQIWIPVESRSCESGGGSDSGEGDGAVGGGKFLADCLDPGEGLMQGEVTIRVSRCDCR